MTKLAKPIEYRSPESAGSTFWILAQGSGERIQKLQAPGSTRLDSQSPNLDSKSRALNAGSYTLWVSTVGAVRWIYFLDFPGTGSGRAAFPEFSMDSGLAYTGLVSYLYGVGNS